MTKNERLVAKNICEPLATFLKKNRLFTKYVANVAREVKESANYDNVLFESCVYSITSFAGGFIYYDSTEGADFWYEFEKIYRASKFKNVQP